MLVFLFSFSGSNYEVETRADNAIDLENIPWIYQNHKSFVFGVQRPTEAGSFSILLTVSVIGEPVNWRAVTRSVACPIRS